MQGRWLRGALLLLVVFQPLVFSGCDRGKSGLVKCSGTVTLDGQPLSAGVIEFLPANRDGPTAAVKINDGKYEIGISPGKKTIVIQAFRFRGEEHAMPGDPESPMVPIRKNIRTKPFNQASNDTIEITESRYDCDFDLKTK